MQKLKILFLLILMNTGSRAMAQETFIIDNDTLHLQQEVKGTLNLYWTQQGNRYRYFVQKGKRMLELRRDLENGIPHYRKRLDTLTADADMNTANVQFVLYSLRNFANQYNAKVQEDYTYNASTPSIRKKVKFFTGLSNNIYTENPDNQLAPVIGVEFEIEDPNLAPRHSAFLHLRQSFKQKEFRYSSTQLSLNYRFKFIHAPDFYLHIDTELATFQYSQNKINILDGNGNITDVKEEEGFSFKVPLSFGVGGDIKVTDQSYISMSYNDVVSVFLDSNGSFPIDFTLGYKYKL